jgi:hypothetical protein
MEHSHKTFAVLVSVLLLFASPAHAAGGGYFNAEIGAVFYDLPDYKDGFGVVSLAPVSGPYLVDGGKQTGAALTLGGGFVTNRTVRFMNGTLFFDVSANYGSSEEKSNTTLGSDPSSNTIRFGLFNGSNGYNSSDAFPLNYLLISDIVMYSINPSIGVESRRGAWIIRTQAGPYLVRLNQNYVLRGTNPSSSTSFYNRDEALDTKYNGIRVALSGSKKSAGSKMTINAAVGLSVFSMKANYHGFDDREGGGGSSLTRSISKTAVGVDAKLGFVYPFWRGWQIGASLSVNYLNKIPAIVHATGATGNGSFVPASLKTESGNSSYLSLVLSKTF